MPFQVCLAVLKTLQRIRYVLVDLACLTVKIEQELLAIMHEEVRACVRTGRPVVGFHVANLDCLACGRVNHRAVGSTEHCFGLAVAVPVIGDDVVLVVLEVGHIRAEVNPPKFGTIELVDLDDGIFALIAAGQIALCGIVAVVKLEQNLQLAVAVDIGATGVIGNVGALQVAVIHLNLKIVVRPRLHLR